MDFYDRHPDAPSASEAAREQAESTCARVGHYLGETEDGDLVCERCGIEPLDLPEPQDSAEDSDQSVGPDGDVISKADQQQALIDWDSASPETFGLALA